MLIPADAGQSEPCHQPAGRLSDMACDTCYGWHAHLGHEMKQTFHQPCAACVGVWRKRVKSDPQGFVCSARRVLSAAFAPSGGSMTVICCPRKLRLGGGLKKVCWLRDGTGRCISRLEQPRSMPTYHEMTAPLLRQSRSSPAGSSPSQLEEQALGGLCRLPRHHDDIPVLPPVYFFLSILSPHHRSTFLPRSLAWRSPD